VFFCPSPSGRGEGAGTRVMYRTSAEHPHPPLRGTFSRREKGKTLFLSEALFSFQPGCQLRQSLRCADVGPVAAVMLAGDFIA